MSIYEQAAAYTLDDNMKKILLNCAKNKWPQQFKVMKGKIYTSSGNIYDMPKEPMDLCNIIHDILHGIDKAIVTVTPTRSSKSQILLGGNIGDDAIYNFARRESARYGFDSSHTDKLYSCIYTAIYVGDIINEDIEMENSIITRIRGIDTRIPCIIDKNKQ